MAARNVAKKRLATAQSLAASFTTAATNIENLDSICWKIATSGVTDNTGTFSFQTRVKLDESNYSTWIDEEFDPAPTLASANTTFSCFATRVEGTEARLKFTAAGGTPNGTAEIVVIASRVGA